MTRRVPETSSLASTKIQRCMGAQAKWKDDRSSEPHVCTIRYHRITSLNSLMVFCCWVQGRFRWNLRMDRRQGFRRDWQPRSTDESHRRHPRSCWKNRQPPRPSRTALLRKFDRFCGVGRLSRSFGRSFGEAQPLGGARLDQRPLWERFHVPLPPFPLVGSATWAQCRLEWHPGGVGTGYPPPPHLSGVLNRGVGSVHDSAIRVATSYSCAC